MFLYVIINIACVVLVKLYLVYTFLLLIYKSAVKSLRMAETTIYDAYLYILADSVLILVLTIDVLFM